MGHKPPDFSASRWTDAMAPSLDDITHLAREALHDLPEPFPSLARDVIVRVDDFPDQDALDDLGLESPFELLGLFVGRGLSEGGAAMETGEGANAIWLYRRPILDYWAEHEETLDAVVRHVFVHELGHHIGLSDDDMERIEAGA